MQRFLLTIKYDGTALCGWQVQPNGVSVQFVIQNALIELTGEAIKTSHNSFRNNAYLFDEELQDRGFGKCSFRNSPFANAIVVDAYGQVVTGTENGLFGEVYDSKGELITLESEMGYTIYVRAQDIVGQEYGTSNYPQDAIMYNGVAYVSSSHLYDYEAPSMGSK
jgi:hypothetical protein